MGRLLTFLVCASLCGFAGCDRARETHAPADACKADGELAYLCGLLNAEDLARVGDSRWLIASGKDGTQGGVAHNGHLYLVDHEARTWQEAFPGASPEFAPDAVIFPDCPGPIDTGHFSAHGLSLAERSPGRFRLYMTSHGAREAIEVFDVEIRGDGPALVWVGCVPIPPGVETNSVAILPDGGFVATEYLDSKLPREEAFRQVNSGQISGQLHEWHPGGQVLPLEGTRLSGPNGIVVSADGRSLYVAAYGTHELVRFDRGSGGLEKTVAVVNVWPDNLRWTPQGKLLVAGDNVVDPADCKEGDCYTGWSVLEVDPQDFSYQRVAGADRHVALHGVSTGLLVGRQVWIGTTDGDRIGYLPLRRP